MITGKIIGSIFDGGNKNKVNVKASGVLMKSTTLGFNDHDVRDFASDIFGNRITIQLVSSTVGDPNNYNRGVIGDAANVDIDLIPSVQDRVAGETKFNATLKWDLNEEIPGAIIIKNNHTSEFFLKSVTIDNFPGEGHITFICNSWVYPAKNYKYDRIFFTNDTYLPGSTPEPLKPYREEELRHLRGDNVNGMLQEHDRVYGYAFYNDLGDPDMGKDSTRPILGGSKEYPYPRRGRTGRPPSKTDPQTESRLPLITPLDIYVPRDERFGHLKMSDFLTNTIKAIVQVLLPFLDSVFGGKDFVSFQEILNMYDGGIELPFPLQVLEDTVPFNLLNQLNILNGRKLLKLPLPRIIQDSKDAWNTDEEFAREVLAGVNPLVIRRIQEFPPKSNLDPKVYGDHTSSITASDIEKNLEGTVDEAINDNKLFILDHHDSLFPYLNRINNGTASKVYASRTIFSLKKDGTLKPLAIELSLPHPNGVQDGAINRVFTPADNGVEGAIWKLAKAYVSVDDYGMHQLVSHWLNTHAVMEPFIIATNRQLSAMHPIHKLLIPHYRDTMTINALARQSLINAGGIFETTVFQGKYALEMSAVLYKNWKLTDQALPTDLLKRGVAIEDSSKPNNIRLLIEDYPYAVDGLSIWFAIETWVKEYCSIYYPDDATLQGDTELQAWWKEIRDVGHGDKKDETWWPKMQTISELNEVCTIIIWVASALHAAVNFGQYPYCGYLPNRPSISRRFMPEPGTSEYEELKKDPERYFLKTITNKRDAILGISLLEILSTHASDEVYLGQRSTPEWTSDQKALEAFKKFGYKLVEIENTISTLNGDSNLKNRNGPVKFPYTLLYPNTSDYSSAGGITAKGIPNSISI